MVLIGLQRWPFKSLLTHKTLLLPMQVTDASKAEVARRERERLRLQAKQKKDQLEKLRDQQNDDTATGEVSSHQSFINKKMSLVNGQAVHFLQNHSGPVANIPTNTWALLQAERGQKRLQFLLKQAEVFQHFAPAASEKEKK